MSSSSEYMTGISFSKEDIKLLEDKFEAMSFKEQRKVFYQTLATSANIVKRQTKANLSSVSVKSGTLKVSKEMKKGVISKVKIRSSTDMYAYIHIFGDKRLKYYENGTKDRYVKFRKKTDGRSSKAILKRNSLSKPRYTGNIMASGFFNKALGQTSGKVFRNMQSVILEKINKVWKASTVQNISTYRRIARYEKDSGG